MALQAACAGLGGALGALIGGLVLSATGSYNATYWTLGAVLLVGAAVLYSGKRSLQGRTTATLMVDNVPIPDEGG